MKNDLGSCLKTRFAYCVPNLTSMRCPFDSNPRERKIALYQKTWSCPHSAKAFFGANLSSEKMRLQMNIFGSFMVRVGLLPDAVRPLKLSCGIITFQVAHHLQKSLNPEPGHPPRGKTIIFYPPKLIFPAFWVPTSREKPSGRLFAMGPDYPPLKRLSSEELNTWS